MSMATLVTPVDQTWDFQVKNTDLQLWTGHLDVSSLSLSLTKGLVNN